MRERERERERERATERERENIKNGIIVLEWGGCPHSTCPWLAAH